MKKIIGIILGCIIAVILLLTLYGFYLEKQEQGLSNNSQQNSTMTDPEIKMTDSKKTMTQSDLANPKKYEEFADKVFNELGKGNIKYLKDNLSQGLVDDNSQETIDNILLPSIKEFFADFDHIDTFFVTHSSSDSHGNSGFSFGRRIIFKDGSMQGFKLYIVNENGRLVVANAVTFEI